MEIDWDALEDLWEQQIDHPAFAQLSKKYVPGEGDNPIAFLMGEAPGAQEDLVGRPFVGASGVALRDLMRTAGLSSESLTGRANCWLTNVVKFRPPGNRTPTPKEIEAAQFFLREEWISVGCPRLIVPIGGTALKAIIKKPMSITRVAGKPHAWRSRYLNRLVWVFPQIHPRFGLSNPQARPLMERDWEALRDWIRENAGLIR